jgi:hypothetical protein
LPRNRNGLDARTHREIPHAALRGCGPRLRAQSTWRAVRI